MYTIYLNNRKLTICKENEPELENPNSIIYSFGAETDLAQLVNYFRDAENIKALYVPVEESKVEQTFKHISSQFLQLNAGGGVVFNSKGEILLIKRLGVWDLPKGKQEPNEDIRVCSLREVEEECGVASLELKEQICITRHCYHLKGNFILKHTHWYKMLEKKESTLKPQLEEDIQECIWVKPENLHKYLENTYPSIREVFNSLSIL